MVNQEKREGVSSETPYLWSLWEPVPLYVLADDDVINGQ
jgi:hypothetical protein